MKSENAVSKKGLCAPCLLGAVAVLIAAGIGAWFILRTEAPARGPSIPLGASPAASPEANAVEPRATDTPLFTSSPSPEPTPLESPATSAGEASVEDIIRYGQNLVSEHRAAGRDLNAGPCLDDGETFPGWVIDVAHDPRQAIDDRPENQCPAFSEGRADKFVELAPDGSLIATYP